MLMKTQGVDGHLLIFALLPCCIFTYQNISRGPSGAGERKVKKGKRNSFFFPPRLCNDSEVARLQCTVPGCQSLKGLILST